VRVFELDNIIYSDKTILVILESLMDAAVAVYYRTTAPNHYTHLMQYACSTVAGSHAKLGETTANEKTLHTSSTPQCLHQDVSLLVTCLDDFAAAHPTMILCTSSVIATAEET
jgi:hypothetical protein